ncbi:hypothetical protein FB451DRAFT_272685 [Mycena latifolia]|nr:hypothetical protein FB451DRAFT_272685 [Mycena latifolia]
MKTRPISTDHRLNELLRYEDTSTKSPTYHASPIVPPIDPSFCPMASAPPAILERIWSRVLFFAMLSLEQHPANTPSWRLPDQKVNSGRLQFLLLSKLFHRLARPYLYYYPIFSDRANFPSFANALSAQPTLGKHIRELDVRQDHEISFFVRQRTCMATRALASIFPHTSHLTHLLGSGFEGVGFEAISWSDFITLATTVGSTLQEFAGINFKVDAAKHSPAIFQRYARSRENVGTL